MYAKERSLRLALSTPPAISFMHGNELITVDIALIVAFYETKKKEQARERAKERRREARERLTDETVIMRT